MSIDFVLLALYNQYSHLKIGGIVMFGKDKVAEAMKAKIIEQHNNALELITRQVSTMQLSENYMFVYGMICFAFDMGLITYEERQYLSEIARSKANELRDQEKAQAQKDKEEKARIIAEYEAATGKQKK